MIGEVASARMPGMESNTANAMTVAPAAFITLAWKRKRLIGEAPPEPGWRVSKYAKAAMVVFAILLVDFVTFFSVMQFEIIPLD